MIFDALVRDYMQRFQYARTHESSTTLPAARVHMIHRFSAIVCRSLIYFGQQPMWN